MKKFVPYHLLQHFMDSVIEFMFVHLEQLFCLSCTLCCTHHRVKNIMLEPGITSNFSVSGGKCFLTKGSGPLFRFMIPASLHQFCQLCQPSSITLDIIQRWAISQRDANRHYVGLCIYIGGRIKKAVRVALRLNETLVIPE